MKSTLLGHFPPSRIGPERCGSVYKGINIAREECHKRERRGENSHRWPNSSFSCHRGFAYPVTACESGASRGRYSAQANGFGSRRLVQGACPGLPTSRSWTTVVASHRCRKRRTRSANWPLRSLERRAGTAVPLAARHRERIRVCSCAWSRVARLDRLTITILGGNGYRLPTEAECEYACRAPQSPETATKHPFGDNDDDLLSYAWCDNNSEHKTHPAGQKKPNRWGLYDMQGNVWECCQDLYSADYYNFAPARDPRGPVSASVRVGHPGRWLELRPQVLPPGVPLRVRAGVPAQIPGFPSGRRPAIGPS